MAPAQLHCARLVDRLARSGEAGAKRRVRDLSAWRHSLAPGLDFYILYDLKSSSSWAARRRISRPHLPRPRFSAK